jgi:hypothetical protein
LSGTPGCASAVQSIHRFHGSKNYSQHNFHCEIGAPNYSFFQVNNQRESVMVNPKFHENWPTKTFPWKNMEVPFIGLKRCKFFFKLNMVMWGIKKSIVNADSKKFNLP